MKCRNKLGHFSFSSNEVVPYVVVVVAAAAAAAAAELLYSVADPGGVRGVKSNPPLAHSLV